MTEHDFRVMHEVWSLKQENLKLNQKVKDFEAQLKSYELIGDDLKFIGADQWKLIRAEIAKRDKLGLT